jgi:hypothetical protein
VRRPPPGWRATRCSVGEISIARGPCLTRCTP